MLSAQFFSRYLHFKDRYGKYHSISKMLNTFTLKVLPCMTKILFCMLQVQFLFIPQFYTSPSHYCWYIRMQPTHKCSHSYIVWIPWPDGVFLFLTMHPTEEQLFQGCEVFWMRLYHMANCSCALPFCTLRSFQSAISLCLFCTGTACSLVICMQVCSFV